MLSSLFESLTLVTRRFALKLGVAAGVSLRPHVSLAVNTGAIRVGAIRWDAWYGGVAGKDNSWFAAHNLDPARYHSRAPWFAVNTGPNSMSIVGDKTSIDSEIRYAATAGLKFWAFCKYEKSSSFTQAWKLFQESTLKYMINWCWIYSYGQFHHDVTEEILSLVAQCSQQNYETAGEKRPMIFLMADKGATSNQILTDIIALRAACAAKHVANPYVITMNGSADNAKSAYAAIGADAISSYGFAQPTTYGTYASLDAATREFWSDLARTDLPLVPCGVTGWDRRPRIEHPVPWERATQKINDGMANSFAAARPSEIAAHIKALIAFIREHPSACPSRSGLIYAWDEFDEGGWLCPTWTDAGPDDTRLKAIQGIL